MSAAMDIPPWILFNIHLGVHRHPMNKSSTSIKLQSLPNTFKQHQETTKQSKDLIVTSPCLRIVLVNGSQHCYAGFGRTRLKPYANHTVMCAANRLSNILWSEQLDTTAYF